MDKKNRHLAFLFLTSQRHLAQHPLVSLYRTNAVTAEADVAQPNQSSIVTKVGQVIDILVRAQKPLTFSELVERTGFVKSSAHRILSVMLTEGLIEHNQKVYRLGPRLVNWARAAWSRPDLQEVAAHEMQKFCEKTGFNIALSIMDQDKVLYLRTIDPKPVRYAAHAGERAPLHCTGVGKAYLAFLSDAQRTDLLPRLVLDRYTENTKITVAELERDLADIRRRGYGTCDREEFLHVVGIGAPILDENGNPVAGISVWITTDIADMVTLEKCAPDLLSMTKNISRSMDVSMAG